MDLKSIQPINAPISWKAINVGTELGAMPEKVSVWLLAKVTAGLAKDVDEVKKYADPIQLATTKGAKRSFFCWPRSWMMNISPPVATTSPSQIFQPFLKW